MADSRRSRPGASTRNIGANARRAGEASTFGSSAKRRKVASSQDSADDALDPLDESGNDMLVIASDDSIDSDEVSGDGSGFDGSDDASSTGYLQASDLLDHPAASLFRDNSDDGYDSDGGEAGASGGLSDFIACLEDSKRKLAGQLPPPAHNPSPAERMSTASRGLPENEYGSIGAPSRRLDATALLQGSSAKGLSPVMLSSLQRLQVHSHRNASEALDIPAPHRERERTERDAAYQSRKRMIAKWDDSARHARGAGAHNTGADPARFNLTAPDVGQSPDVRRWNASFAPVSDFETGVSKFSMTEHRRRAKAAKAAPARRTTDDKGRGLAFDISRAAAKDTLQKPQKPEVSMRASSTPGQISGTRPKVDGNHGLHSSRIVQATRDGQEGLLTKASTTANLQPNSRKRAGASAASHGRSANVPAASSSRELDPASTPFKARLPGDERESKNTSKHKDTPGIPPSPTLPCASDGVVANPWTKSGRLAHTKYPSTLTPEESDKSPLSNPSQRPVDQCSISIDADASLRLETRTSGGPGTEQALQRKLAEQAFAEDAVLAEFEAEKLVHGQQGDAQQEESFLPGWGTWSGSGNRKRKWRPHVKQPPSKESGPAHLLKTAKKLNRIGKYQATSVAFPYSSATQHNLAMGRSLAPERMTQRIQRHRTRPNILSTPGFSIAPLH